MASYALSICCLEVAQQLLTVVASFLLLDYMSNLFHNSLLLVILFGIWGENFHIDNVRQQAILAGVTGVKPNQCHV